MGQWEQFKKELEQSPEKLPRALELAKLLRIRHLLQRKMKERRR